MKTEQIDIFISFLQHRGLYEDFVANYNKCIQNHAGRRFSKYTTGARPLFVFRSAFKWDMDKSEDVWSTCNKVWEEMCFEYGWTPTTMQYFNVTIDKYRFCFNILSKGNQMLDFAEDEWNSRICRAAKMLDYLQENNMLDVSNTEDTEKLYNLFCEEYNRYASDREKMGFLTIKNPKDYEETNDLKRVAFTSFEPSSEPLPKDAEKAEDSLSTIGLKVVGHIDLDAINTKIRPTKSTKEERAEQREKNDDEKEQFLVDWKDAVQYEKYQNYLASLSPEQRLSAEKYGMVEFSERNKIEEKITNVAKSKTISIESAIGRAIDKALKGDLLTCVIIESLDADIEKVKSNYKREVMSILIASHNRTPNFPEIKQHITESVMTTIEEFFKTTDEVKKLAFDKITKIIAEDILGKPVGQATPTPEPAPEPVEELDELTQMLLDNAVAIPDSTTFGRLEFSTNTRSHGNKATFSYLLSDELRQLGLIRMQISKVNGDNYVIFSKDINGVQPSASTASKEHTSLQYNSVMLLNSMKKAGIHPKQGEHYVRHTMSDNISKSATMRAFKIIESKIY